MFRRNETKSLLQARTRALKNAEMKIEQRDILIKDLQEENVILLNNLSEARAKIIDLENNIEFLVNQLPKQKRELVRPSKQN